MFLIFRFKDSVGPFETSVWAKYARNSALQECNVFPRRAISGAGQSRAAVMTAAAALASRS
nr:hypothetical protein [Mycobacterium sp. SM1]